MPRVIENRYSRDDEMLSVPLDLPGDTSRNAAPHRPKRRQPLKKILIIVGGLILLSALAFGGWILMGQKDPAKPATDVATDNAQPQSTRDTKLSTGDVPDVTETKTFKGDRPRIQFSYPASWTVTENDGGVRVESPDFSYKTLDGAEPTGLFRIYIRTGARAVDSKYIGRGVAAEPSEKLVYAEPATGQRAETNLTHFGLDSSDNFAYFLIAGNYVLQKDETLGPGYGKEPETYIITGGYSTKELTDDLATNSVSLEYAKQSKAYEQALNIIKSLKLL